MYYHYIDFQIGLTNLLRIFISMFIKDDGTVLFFLYQQYVVDNALPVFMSRKSLFIKLVQLRNDLELLLLIFLFSFCSSLLLLPPYFSSFLSHQPSQTQIYIHACMPQPSLSIYLHVYIPLTLLVLYVPLKQVTVILTARCCPKHCTHINLLKLCTNPSRQILLFPFHT